jgi:hypothetical protein
MLPIHFKYIDKIMNRSGHISEKHLTINDAEIEPDRMYVMPLPYYQYKNPELYELETGIS